MRQECNETECICVTKDDRCDSICPIHNPEEYKQEKERSSPRGWARYRKIIKDLIKNAEGLGW